MASICVPDHGQGKYSIEVVEWRTDVQNKERGADFGPPFFCSVMPERYWRVTLWISTPIPGMAVLSVLITPAPVNAILKSAALGKLPATTL